MKKLNKDKIFSKQNIKWFVLIFLFMVALVVMTIGLVYMQPGSSTLLAGTTTTTSVGLQDMASAPTWRIIAIIAGLFGAIVLSAIGYEIYQAAQRRRVRNKLNNND